MPRTSYLMADDVLVSIQDTLTDMIRAYADDGDTMTCDLLHGRIARIGDVRAILTGEDDTLNDISTAYLAR